jgi:hypothetical protein
MEDSLRDLLERLSDIAAGAPNNHDKPANIVEEAREILDHLAEDELPAASAIFLAKVCAFSVIFFFTPKEREREISLPPPPPPLLPTRPTSPSFHAHSPTKTRRPYSDER